VYLVSSDDFDGLFLADVWKSYIIA